MKYRSEIDGLRAIAVLPVVLFHTGFGLLAGGFIGVDVFFVISGYLITTIIITEIDKGNFSIINFYDRRARRILPALIITLVMSSFFATYLLLPDPLENFGQSIVSTVFFSNNILLYLTSGYWDLQSEFKPLIHTWSLGIEEQFYLLFPIILIFISSKFRIFVIAIILTLSLYAAIFHYGENSPFSFYMIHTRAWELLFGSLAAIFLYKNNQKNNNLLSAIGLTLILGSYFLFDEHVRHPGLFTTIPIIGVVLVILFGGSGTYTGKALSNSILVKIGLASYSIYLFHQPILAFIKAYSVEQPSGLVYFFGLVFTFLAAFLSLKFIEKPARQVGFYSNCFFYSSMAVTLSLLVGYGLFLHTTQGMASRDFNGTYNPLEKSKLLSQRAFEYKIESFDSESTKNIFIVGNSFARDVVNIIVESFDLEGAQLIYSDEYDACKVLYDFEQRGKSYDSDVILFGSNYLGTKHCIPELINKVEDAEKNVFFVGTKQFGYNLNWVSRLPSDKKILLKNSVLPTTISSEELLKAAVGTEANFISIMDKMTLDNQIFITDDSGNLISDDRDHLTLSGARFVGNKVFLRSELTSVLRPLNDSK